MKIVPDLYVTTPVVNTLLVFLLAFMFWGCGKDNATGPGPLQPLTQAEQQAILDARDSIAATANAILGAENPSDGFSHMLDSYRALPAVDTAWIAGQGLFVKFKKGGVISWNAHADPVVPPYDGAVGLPRTLRVMKPAEFIGNSQACLINQQYNDEGNPFSQSVIAHLKTLFQSDGYTVAVKNGGEATLNFFQMQLKTFGALFIITHGSFDGRHCWLMTGEEGSLTALMTTSLASWANGEVAIATIRERRNNAAMVVRYYSFSEGLINSSYIGGDLPHSLIYLSAGEGLASPVMANAFLAKGAAVTIGWGGANCLGQSTGKLLFDALLGGDDVAGAFASVPAESKTDSCAAPSGASLEYYPPAGGTLRLVQSVGTKLHLDSLLDGAASSVRTVTLAGSLLNADAITGGTVEVNGVATVLRFSGLRFSQPVVLTHGPNRITIGCNGTLQGGRPVRVDSTVTVTGTFAAFDLRSELRWNTDRSDIDLHLLPPNSTLTDLWSFRDCYYGNQSTSWGGQIDGDSIHGYGPEHITVPFVTVDGTYRLFIHYYRSNGAGATQASVSVTAKNGDKMNFGPYQMVNDGGNNHGDLWEVCTISFPSGQVTSVNHLYQLGFLGKTFRLPGK